MESTLAVHRLTFAFTVNYHYLFPQLTMGLALLIVILKTLALRTGEARYDHAARFWARLFAISFAMGVVTGIPMEFQFGTSWARFSKATGAVIGHLLAMEGVFSFFLESTFLGLFLYGEKRLSPRAHWLVAIGLWIGTWLSGYFITATNAWMQHPVGFTRQPDGTYALASLGALLANPWLLWQYPHTMSGSLLTASFAMASVGAFYLLARRHEEYGRLFLRLAVPAGALAAVVMAFPTGDGQGKMVARHQPVALAAMEGLFQTKEGAPIVLIGQPDIERLRLDNPVEVPRMLSFLTYQRWEAEVKGLDAFPRRHWPDNIPLLYYAYHIMVGLGTLFIAVMAAAAFLLPGGRLFPLPSDAVAADADAPAAVHRQQRGLDHRRAGAPAVAGLRPHADGGRLVGPRLHRQRALRAARLHGHVRRARHPGEALGPQHHVRTRLVDTVTTPMLLKMVESGRLQPAKLATHRFALADIAKAYDAFGDAARERALKVVLTNR